MLKLHRYADAASMTLRSSNDNDKPTVQQEIERIQQTAHIHSLVAADGRRIVWRKFGSGKPLVLLHGGHGDWMHWFRNASALAAIREVWIPDLPGFGDSDDLDEPTFEHLCNATLISLNTLLGASTSVDLAGFSFGGMVASVLASRRPISRLVLVGSGGHGAPRREHPALLNWKKAATPEDRIAMLHANVRTFMFHNPDAVSPLVEAIYARECQRTRFHSRGSWGATTLTGLLAEARVKPLLLWGDQDVTLASPMAFSASLREAGVAHDITLIPGAGHWLQCEAADSVNTLMKAFYTGEAA
jgi:pimeloyl-ACP methyl ester carboxylesterase